VSVEAEEGGRLFVSGQAAPGATVRLYLNESLIAPGGAGGDGRVSFAIGRGVRPGGYRVRLDDVDPVSGEVKTRAEVEFRVPAPLTVEVPPPPSPSITPPRIASSAPPARPDAVATQPGAPAGSARATAPETTAPSRQSQAAAAPQPPAASPRQPSESSVAEGSRVASVAESSGVAAPQAVARPQAAAGDAPMEASPAQGSSARASAGPFDPGTAAPGSSPAPSEATVPAPAPSRGSGSTTVASAAPPPARDLDPATVLIPEVNTAIVGRGDSLWRISRRMYGGGLRYTVIYTANREQIRNPDLIYPGQVFVLPGGAGEAPSR
jgi:hypothetical protein